LFVDSSGKVGVGVASPGNYNGTTTQLTVGNTGGDGGLNIVSDSASRGFINFADGTTGNELFRGRIEYDHSTDDLITRTSGDERLRITSDGKLGLGTSIPVNPIEVVGASTTDTEENYALFRGPGSSQPGVYIGGNSTTASTGATARYGYVRSQSLGGTARALYLQTGTDTRLAIDNTGNVGIGTTSPGTTLEVNGIAKAETIQGFDFTQGFSSLALRALGTGSNSGFLANEFTEIQFSHRRTNDGASGTVARIRSIAESDQTASWPTALGFHVRRFSGDFEAFRIPSTGGAIFSGASSEFVRIDSSGRLLVGTSTARTLGWGIIPKIQSESVGTVSDASLALTLNRSTDASGVRLVFTKTRGSSLGAVDVVQNNDELGNILFCGADGTNADVRGAAIQAFVDGTPGTNDMPGRLVFSTTADGASTPTERMRITSAGRLLVNATAGSVAQCQIRSDDDGVPLVLHGVSGSDLRGLKFSLGTIDAIQNAVAYIDAQHSLSGTLVFQTKSTEAMRINKASELLVGYTSDNGAYKLQVNSQIFATSATIATSDGRYKENVAPLNGSLDLVKALRPVSFTWKPQEDITRLDEEGNEVLVREGHNFPEGTQVGFIAQEVQEVLDGKPWLGSVIKENVRPAVKDNEGNELAPEEQFYGIAEGNLIAVLTNALQEATAKIEDLEARLTAAGL
jgi:hypothetical protein